MLKRRHVTFELTLRDEALSDELVTDIVDEIAQDGPAIMTRRIDMQHRIDADIFYTCTTKQAMRAPADEQIDLLPSRVRFIDVEQPVPGRQGRIADKTHEIRLEACHPAARAHQ